MNMKKLASIITAMTIFAGSAFADEGMWLLPLLEKMNAKAMKELGCELTPKQIYDINNTSLKDAIVQFGGGCTGEIISSEGLLVTNHHCGYGNIQKLSSVEHDYLKDGYWAMNRNEELPCEGLSVTFLEYMQDVTGILEKAEKKARKEFKDDEEKVMEAVNLAAEELIGKAEKDNPYCTVDIQSFYDSNVYYLIVYKTYRDIRFVGAPPSSIGKFGADTDNWMWPRHTGDFSMFRVYADKDNNPAEYSPENVPLKAKNHLKISLAGVHVTKDTACDCWVNDVFTCATKQHLYYNDSKHATKHCCIPLGVLVQVHTNEHTCYNGCKVELGKNLFERHFCYKFEHKLTCNCGQYGNYHQDCRLDTILWAHQTQKHDTNNCSGQQSDTNVNHDALCACVITNLRRTRIYVFHITLSPLLLLL